MRVSFGLKYNVQGMRMTVLRLCRSEEKIETGEDGKA